MIRRPKPGENEEDILRIQEEFLKDKNSKPSAQVVNLRDKVLAEHKSTKRPSPHTGTPSKYAQFKNLSKEKRARVDSQQPVIGSIIEKNNTENEVSQCDDNVSYPKGMPSVYGEIVEKNHPANEISQSDDDNVYFPRVMPSVLGDIVEKNCDDTSTLSFKIMPSAGFPVISIHNSNVKIGVKSIYAQRLGKMDIDQPSSSSSNEKFSALNMPSQSFILSNMEADSIHKENVETLSKMTESEILQEQQKLLSSLDPKLIDFVKSKKRSMSIPKSSDTANVLKTNNSEITSMEVLGDEDIGTTDYLWENDVISHPEINKWIHFEKLEKDKLQWIKSIEDSKNIKPDEPYEARFDFSGYLLPYSMEYTEETKTLYHHGEEPHRPGYSIRDLIELTRSTVIQQRVMALNTIAGVIENYMAGIYKDIIEIPLSKLLFVIRIALDENKQILIEPSLKAMRNLLFNRIDEVCLDSLQGYEVGIYQPCMENDKSEIEEIESKESELNDFHLAEIDLISAILRTDILQRLFYILDAVKPNFNSVQFSLQILTRLSRNSIEYANKIVELSHLIDTIITNFIPPSSLNLSWDINSVYQGKPVLAALKLMRVLSSQSKEISNTLIGKHGLLKSLSIYISSGIDSTYGLRLQIESLCILSNLIQYGLGKEIVFSLCPVIVNTLHKHVQGTDIYVESSVISITHAAVVLQCVYNILKYNSQDLGTYKNEVYLILKEGVQKWLKQLSCSEHYTFAHLKLLSSVLDCCRIVLINEKVTLQFLNETLRDFSLSKQFDKIVANILTGSNLLSGIEDGEVNGNKNLINLGGYVLSKQTLLPIFNINSPLPFMVSLYKLLYYISKDIAKLFLDKIYHYLQGISTKQLSLTNNWFTRIEVDCLFSIVRLSMETDISESFKEVIYITANKLCYILRRDQIHELDYLINNVIFNKNLFTSERLLNLISLSESNSLMALTDLENIKLFYSDVLNAGSNSVSGDITGISLKWQEPILPRDWIYMPILSLYSSSIGSNLSKNKEEEDKRESKIQLIIQCSLEWILFTEATCPELLKDIPITDRLCRIMCVFLCHNSLFLNKQINNLLQKCMEIFSKKSSKFNFDKELTGLSNFQDFYTQLLEQFQSVSYGDYVFSAYVLIPLAQRHNVKWRKLLWSEYAGCLRALDCPDSYLCYNLNEYYYPEEIDESLLKSYSRALSSNLLRPDTIVYKIARHHINKFKERKSVS